MAGADSPPCVSSAAQPHNHHTTNVFGAPPLHSHAPWFGQPGFTAAMAQRPQLMSPAVPAAAAIAPVPSLPTGAVRAAPPDDLMARAREQPRSEPRREAVQRRLPDTVGTEASSSPREQQREAAHAQRPPANAIVEAGSSSRSGSYSKSAQLQAQPQDAAGASTMPKLAAPTAEPVHPSAAPTTTPPPPPADAVACAPSSASPARWC